jgi:hypothetical protein
LFIPDRAGWVNHGSARDCWYGHVWSCFGCGQSLHL